MFDNILKFFKKFSKEEKRDSKDTAKERLHLVLMQDRANVSADFMELMKQEIIEVIKKYIDVDENSIDVKLTNKVNNDGTTGAPMLYANIPIINLKDDAKQVNIERNIQKDIKEEPTIEEEIVEKSDDQETVDEKVSNEEEVKEESVVEEEIIEKDKEEITTEIETEKVEEEKAVEEEIIDNDKDKNTDKIEVE